MLSFRVAAAELQSAVESLDRAPDPADEIWEESATHFLRFLAATIVTADGRFPQAEFRSLEAYHDDGANYHEEAELARVFRRPEMLNRPPAFLTTAWERDPVIARQIRDAIHRVVMALVTADGAAAPEEMTVARTYLSLEGLVGGPYS